MPALCSASSSTCTSPHHRPFRAAPRLLPAGRPGFRARHAACKVLDPHRQVARWADGRGIVIPISCPRHHCTPGRLSAQPRPPRGRDLDPTIIKAGKEHKDHQVQPSTHSLSSSYSPHSLCSNGKNQQYAGTHFPPSSLCQGQCLLQHTAFINGRRCSD